VTFLEGVSVRRPTVDHCAGLGRALAGLHLAGREFPLHRVNALGPAGWPPLLAEAGARADQVVPGLAALLAEELAHLLPRWPQGLPAGVIHADLFPDNVFFLKGALSGVIDPYFACNDLFAYDLAICLNAWCFEPDLQYNQTKARALLAGYQAARPLERAEIAALPLLARGAALRFLLTRLVDWLNVPPGALVKPLDPLAYLKRLRTHRAIASAAEYGVVA
jgi:homoserine kinase type II